MIKLGVTSVAGLKAPRTWLGKEKHVSLLLLADPALSSPGAAGYHERIVKRVLFADGTWRETAVGRLRRLDRLVLGLLQERRHQTSPLRVFDLAAATGCTSVEFYRTLRESFAVEFVASDRTRDVFAIRAPGSRLTIIVDADQGEVLQYINGPFVVPGQGRESVLYPINHLVRRLCVRARAPQLRTIVASARAHECAPFAWVSIANHEVMRLPLLSGECLSMLSRDPHFHYDVADVLHPLAGSADVIRAMNILHGGYFRPPAIRTALRNCLNALSDGGMLVIGRSPNDDPAAVAATVFTKRPGGVEAMARLNGGSEIDDLVHESVA